MRGKALECRDSRQRKQVPNLTEGTFERTRAPRFQLGIFHKRTFFQAGGGPAQYELSPTQSLHASRVEMLSHGRFGRAQKGEMGPNEILRDIQTMRYEWSDKDCKLLKKDNKYKVVPLMKKMIEVCAEICRKYKRYRKLKCRSMTNSGNQSIANKNICDFKFIFLFD